MKRLTTDNPQNNMETMLNYAYAEDKEVKLRYGEREAQSLCEYIAHRAAVFCDCEASPDDVMEGTCVGCEPDCALSILNTVAIQAAENRARLKSIEDILGEDYDLGRIRELVEADREGRCEIMPCVVGTKVYVIGQWYGNEWLSGNIRTGTVKGFENAKNTKTGRCYWVAWISMDDISKTAKEAYEFRSLGKKWFLTREEADAALERMGKA